MSNSPLQKYVAYKTADAVEPYYDPADHVDIKGEHAKYSVFKYEDGTAPASDKKIVGTIGEPVMFAIPKDLELDLIRRADDISRATLAGGRAKSRRGRRGGRRHSKRNYKK